jgi:hypothetical protein
LVELAEISKSFELKEVIVAEIRYIRLARRSITIIGMIGATRRFIMIEREGVVGLTYQWVACVLNVESSRIEKFIVGLQAGASVSPSRRR